jgi:hypothetical protein
MAPGLPAARNTETCPAPRAGTLTAVAKLPLEPDGRALLGVLAHALGQPDGERVVALAPGEFGLTAASPGAASLAFASLDVPAREASRLSGNYRPSPPPAGELGDVTLKREKQALVLELPSGKVKMEEIGGDPIDPAWMWPSATPELEAIVRRDALLEALPKGEGELRYVAADKQLACIAGRQEKRLPLANRPRRRKEISSAVDFDELRLAVAGAGERVTLGIGERRPLTVESGPLRGVLVRTAPRWKPVEAIRDAGKADTAAEAKQREQDEREATKRTEQQRQQAIAAARRRAAELLESAAQSLADAEQELAEAGEATAAVRKLRQRLEKLAADLE